MIKMVIVQKINRIQYLNTRQLRKLTSLISNDCGENCSTVTFPHTIKSINQLKGCQNHHNNISCFAALYHSTSSLLSEAEAQVDFNLFDKTCEETLESLTEFFEDLIESQDKFAKADISYSGGVLTINLGEYGTYVINRQTPNRQIWLSSPFSGPKRYDYVINGSYWIYKRDSISLHEFLEKEIGNILGERVDFSKCVHAKHKIV